MVSQNPDSVMVMTEQGVPLILVNVVDVCCPPRGALLKAGQGAPPPLAANAVQGEPFLAPTQRFPCLWMHLGHVKGWSIPSPGRSDYWHSQWR